MAGEREDGRGNRRSSLQLITFGGPALILGSTNRSLSPLQGALLGLLASKPGDGMSVARAIELLWEPAPPDRLRHRISQLVYSLNRGFPRPMVVKKRDRYCLSGAIATDFQALSAAIANGQPAEAAEIFRRGLLSELTTPPTDAFSDWLDAKGLELRAKIRQASAEQWARLTRQGRWKEALAPARALLSVDPYDERALRMLIRSGAMCGSLREAEAAFLSFAERSELNDKDWAPAAETLSLVDRIRDMGSEAGAKVAAHFESRAPLIGRADEVTALPAAMRPRPGEGLRLVVIRGERGAGKTRLVEESLARGLVSGVRVLRSRASEFERGVFLNSVLDALSASDIAADIHKLTDPWRSTMLELLPEFHTGPGPPPELPAVEPDQVPRRLLEAVRQLLLVIAENDPTILFIDDFHWADRNSVAALRYVGERWPSLPLAIVLAVQTECLRAEDPITRFLDNPTMQCEPSQFYLSEISLDAANELVDTVAATPIEVATRDRIVELGDQNPLFILELTKQHLAGQRLPNLDPEDFVPLPASLARVFADRLAQLDDDAERTLQVLSVCGHPLHVPPLSKLAGLTSKECMEALDQLQRCQLVGWDPRGFVVRKQLIRHAVYDRMNAVRRTWVHGQVACHLEEVEPTATPGELAVHYHHARMRGRALQHALAGARVAEKSFAVEEASRLLSLARLNTDDPLAQARIAVRLARLHYVRRDVAAAPARLAEAALQLREIKRPQSALVAEIQRIELLASCGACSSRKAIVRAREYRSSAEQARHWKAFAKAVDLELQIHRSEGQASQADRLVARAGKLLDKVEPRSRGWLHASLALHPQGDFDAALEHVRQAISIARQTRAQDELLRALGRLIAIQGVRGLINDPEATAAAEEGETLAAEGDDFVERYNLLANVGAGYLVIGQLDRARNWFAWAETVLANVNTCESHVALACRLGELALEEMELEEAAEHFTRAREWWTPGMGRHLGIVSHSGAGLAALRLGKLERARKMESRMAKPPAKWFADPWTFALFKAKMSEWRGFIGRGADSISDIAGLIETSQPAPWARLKFEEARLRLRHSLPLRDEVAETAAKAAANLGIHRWIENLRALQRRGR